ncbi:uncharacterized protein LOC131883153 [Tigriopus californicus]|uniref:uncharacterized protein LOC131883153 n=1 Tax=Tigriopus californicus TaxID=6832 RepID=UPI0027D9EAB4|nr:uncharacterized protein LOC131883153 [Tigriopus californicus]
MHQGRHLTLGAVRNAGFQIQNGRNAIRRMLAKCVVCQRLCGSLESQQMSDLPLDRVEPSPPFTTVGLDIFEPFLAQDGQPTRCTKTQIKSMGPPIDMPCHTSRPHRNAARHGYKLLPKRKTTIFFFALRGSVKVIQSDQGTNIVGSMNPNQDEPDHSAIYKIISRQGCELLPSPLHASHFGGVWERKIGSVRPVSEGALLNLHGWTLSRDKLGTLLCEVSAVVKSTPLWEVSHDPNDPMSLTPAMLPTLKIEPHTSTSKVFTEKDVLAYGKRRWQCVLSLADPFWVLMATGLSGNAPRSVQIDSSQALATSW